MSKKGAQGAIGGNQRVKISVGDVEVQVSYGAGSDTSHHLKSADTGNQAPAAAPIKDKAPVAAAKKEMRVISADEVAKHNKKDDCWVTINGQVLDVTKFLPDHPGGAKAILLYAGKEASEEFNMLHKPDVIQKYAAYTIIGTAPQKSKL